MPATRSGAPLPAPWLILIVLLSAAPILKIGDVQAVEIVQVVCIALAAPRFIYGGLRVPSSGFWREVGHGYWVFLGLCVSLSLVSLRLPFFPPPGISLLKQPLWLSLSRIFELFLVVYFMIAAAATLKRHPVLFLRVLDLYVAVGVVSACLSIIGWVLKSTAKFPTFIIYGADSRARGFFNEGGPYGMFLVSVAVVVLLRSRMFRPLRLSMRIGILSTLFIALLLSASKAGLLAAVGLCCAGVLVAGSRLQKAAVAAACALVLTVLLSLFGAKVFGYFYAYMNLDEVLAYHLDDPNMVMGRIAASVIVPRMIAAHPVLGIGVGNYSLMRNDPEYLQNLPVVDGWDLSGMGLFGSAAELGVPLTVFFLVLLVRPLMRSVRARQPSALSVAAAFQPMAFLLGVNLNFFYPWLVAAFVIAAQARLMSGTNQ